MMGTLEACAWLHSAQAHIDKTLNSSIQAALLAVVTQIESVRMMAEHNDLTQSAEDLLDTISAAEHWYGGLQGCLKAAIAQMPDSAHLTQLTPVQAEALLIDLSAGRKGVAALVRKMPRMAWAQPGVLNITDASDLEHSTRNLLRKVLTCFDVLISQLPGEINKP